MSSSKKLNLLASNPNLKRDRSSFLSTQDTHYLPTQFSMQADRHSMDSPMVTPLQLDGIPKGRLSDNFSTIQQRLSSKKNKQPVSPPSSHPNTRDRISSYFAYDDQYSRCRARMKQDSSYYHLSQNTFTFGQKPIPGEVIDEYNRALTISRDPAKTIVCRGYLPEISHAYYTINNVVFFVNMAPCFKLRSMGEPVRVKVGKGVIKIIQCKLRRSMLKNKQQKVLVMVHSQALSFYLAYTDDFGKLYVEDLHIGLSLPGQVVSEVAFSESGDLFYIDRDGDLNIISDKPSKRLFVFKTGYQELYTKNRQPSAVGQFINKYREQGFNESLKYVSRAFSQRWNRFLANTIFCRSLHVDNKRKLIIALIVKVYSNALQDCTIAVYRLHQDSKASMIHSINNIELYKILSGFGILLNPHCFNVFKLYSVQESYFPDSNVLIVLSNGTRIYVQITKDFVKPLKTIYPPNISEGYLRGSKLISKSPIIIKSERVQMRGNNQIELVDCSLKRELFLQFYKMSSRLMAYLSSRSNSYERPVIGEVNWQTFGNPGTSYPQEISSFPVLQSCFFPAKVGQLICGMVPTRYQLTCPQLHDLAKQVYISPDFLVMMSERQVELVCRLRPIDIVVLWLTKLQLQDCQIKFQEAIKIWKRVEIVSMLLMVLCDKQGVYYTTNELVRSIQAEVSRRRSKVDSFQINFRNEPKMISAAELDKSVIQKAHILFNQMGDINEPIKEQEDVWDVYSVLRKDQMKIQPCSTKEQALCLYLCRILRPVWWRDAKELSEDETKFISDKLGHLYEHIASNPINSLDVLITKSKEGPRQQNLSEEVQGFTQRCIQLLAFLRTVYCIPEGQFQQLVAQDNAFFEVFLFNQLHKHDNSIISYWTVEFSKLVDEKFFKVARLYFRVRDIHDERSLISMCEDFGELPIYFLDDLKKHRNINTQTLRRYMIGKPRREDLLREGHPEQRYQSAIELISSSHHIDEKIRYTEIAIESSNALLENRALSRQMRYTYQNELAQLIRKKRQFYIQKALIDAMMSRGSSSTTQIINLLHRNEFDPNNLKESVLKSGDETAIFIWYLNFPPANSAEYNISAELDKLINIHHMKWPKSLQENLRYIFGLIDQTTKQLMLQLFVTKVQNSNFQMYEKEFENIVNSPTINFKKRSPYWFSQLLLAQGFSINDIVKAYSNRALQAMTRIQTEEYNQQLVTNLYYGLFALHNFVSLVGLVEPKTITRPLFQECIDRLLHIDRISPQKSKQLRALFTKFKDIYD